MKIFANATQPEKDGTRHNPRTHKALGIYAKSFLRFFRFCKGVPRGRGEGAPRACARIYI
jgi:hypothetical protein